MLFYVLPYNCFVLVLHLDKTFHYTTPFSKSLLHNMYSLYTLYNNKPNMPHLTKYTYLKFFNHIYFSMVDDSIVVES